MRILDILGFGKKPIEEQPLPDAVQEQPKVDFSQQQHHNTPTPTAYFETIYPQYKPPQLWTGSDTIDGLGGAGRIMVDYYSLGAHAWEASLKSEICSIVIERFATWMIGEYMTLQAEPSTRVLKMHGITIDSENVTPDIEELFHTHTDSTLVDYANMKTLGLLSVTALKNAIIGGNCLVIFRIGENDLPTIQLIDAENLGNPPWLATNGVDQVNKDNGNVIRGGVEINKRNEHVAYWVRRYGLTVDYERIPVYNRSSIRKMAVLVTGKEYRLDNTKGITQLSTVLGTSNQLKRYRDATLGTAEEQAKITFQVVRTEKTDNSNPWKENMADMLNFPNRNDPNFGRDINGRELANKVTVTTGKQAIDTGIGNEIKPISMADNQLYFNDFYTAHINLICATLGIPPNVAMMLYNDSFSASRAALKDWEHQLKVKRYKFYNEILRPYYELWLDCMVLKKVIKLPGYLEALMTNNRLVLNAFTKCKFEGVNVPHIDPEKEVRAEKLKLGSLYDAMPMTTLEKATRAVNGGNSTDNIRQAARELEEAQNEGLNIIPPDTGGGQQPDNSGSGEVYVKGHYAKKRGA